MYDEFHERGLQIIHAIIDDGTGDGIVDYRDARKWANGNDGAFPALDPGIIVLADDDYSLWTRFLQDCSVIGCTCNYTPQWQIIDQGGVTVADPCAVPPAPEVQDCGGCGYDEAHVYRVLNGILPEVWCGESMP